MAEIDELLQLQLKITLPILSAMHQQDSFSTGWLHWTSRPG